MVGEGDIFPGEGAAMSHKALISRPGKSREREWKVDLGMLLHPFGRTRSQLRFWDGRFWGIMKWVRRAGRCGISTLRLMRYTDFRY